MFDKVIEDIYPLLRSLPMQKSDTIICCLQKLDQVYLIGIH